MTEEELRQLGIEQENKMQTQAAISERNARLAETDYAALPDTPEMSDAMRTYRQALRDVPAQSGFPSDITWPEKPEG